MKLIKARVQNFRTVEDSTEFTIEEGITCLVGKNEAGKTALLTALYRLNPTFPSKFDVEIDYPRRFLTDYDERHPEGDAEVVRTWWQLERSELDALEKLFGEGALASEIVEVSRTYNQQTPTYDVAFNEGRIVTNLIEVSGSERVNANETAGS